MKPICCALAAVLLLTGCAYPGRQTERVVREEDQSIPVELERVEAGTAICLGSLDLEEGRLLYDIQAQSGSGLFVALHPEPDITTCEGTSWNMFVDGVDLPFLGDERTVRVSQGLSFTGTYYVYVGSENTALEEIAGKVAYYRE